MKETKQALTLNFSLLSNYINNEDKQKFQKKIKTIHDNIHQNCNNENGFLGWINLPLAKDNRELLQIMEIANEIRSKSAIMIVIGIGGSYLGAKAIQDALSPYFIKKTGQTEVVYAGQNLSGAYINQLIEYIENREVYVNVISKSGTTLEPAITFRVIKSYMEQRYGKDIKNRIIITTDASLGVLRELASAQQYGSF